MTLTLSRRRQFGNIKAAETFYSIQQSLAGDTGSEVLEEVEHLPKDIHVIVYLPTSGSMLDYGCDQAILVAFQSGVIRKERLQRFAVNLRQRLPGGFLQMPYSNFDLKLIRRDGLVRRRTGED